MKHDGKHFIGEMVTSLVSGLTDQIAGIAVLESTAAAVPGLQTPQAATDQKVQALAEHQSEAAMRIEALEQRVTQLADPAFAQPVPDERYDELSRRLQAIEHDAKSVDVSALGRRLDTVESTSQPPRHSPPNVPSGPTTPEGGFSTRRPGPLDPCASDPTVLRAFSTSHLPQDAVLAAAHHLARAANIPTDGIVARGPILGDRYFIKFDCLPGPAAQRVTAFLANLRRDDASYTSFQPQGPNNELVDTNFYADRPLADRAKKAETLSAAKIFDQMGVQYTDANGRDGVIADEWTVLASCNFDLDRPRSHGDVQALQAALDARPRRTKPDRQRHRVNRWRAADAAPPAATQAPNAVKPLAPHHDGATQRAPPPNIFAPGNSIGAVPPAAAARSRRRPRHAVHTKRVPPRRRRRRRTPTRPCASPAHRSTRTHGDVPCRPALFRHAR